MKREKAQHVHGKEPRLKPFFTFYGAKFRAAPHYPEPQSVDIIEPFAGSACYSLLYPTRRIHLIDSDPIIAGLWEYLIHVSESEIMELPDLPPGASTDDLHVSPAARWLIGFWINLAPASPRKHSSAWARRPLDEWKKLQGSPRPMFWGPRVRERIASQLAYIRHWRVRCDDYHGAPMIVPATWFIDPPYQQPGTGKHYRRKVADYEELGRWCKARPGQIIVCEGAAADWLPFTPFGTFKSNASRTGRAFAKEVIWTRSA